MSCSTHRQIGQCRRHRRWQCAVFLIVCAYMASSLATPTFAWEQKTAPAPASYAAATYSGGHVTPIVWMLPILVLLFIYRRPAGAKPNQLNDAKSSSEIASLGCSRCGRVLELPRDKAARQLFCPRCGSTLPRIR